MNYAKVQQEINNIVEDNVKLLAQLFPAAVKDGQVDFEALKEEFGQFEEVGKEKYELTWVGKQDAKKKAQEDVYKRTLKYNESDSKNPETTENLYIEGDNLEVLKLLRQNYYGAIKMIYIDPPYNTGNDFVYNDNFDMSVKESDIAEGIRGDEGTPLQKNQQSSNRYHANWLNMMYPRLKVTKDLLTDDGVIFISIDDNEEDNLKKICNEVFGESNFIEKLVWKRRATPPNDRVIGKNHEYILVFAKNIENVEIYLQPRSEEINSRYKNLDNDPRGRWAASDLSANGKGGRLVESCVFPITNPKTNEGFNPPPNKCWLYNKEKIDLFMEEGRIGFRENSGAPFLKRYLSEVRQGSTLATILEDAGFSSDSAKEIKSLFNKDVFEFTKPLSLMKKLIRTGVGEDGIILDFFSGSSSTAHAVLELNGEDNLNRKFIMVQIQEDTDINSEAYKAGYENLCEIGKERIRRAGEKIKQEIEASNAQLKTGEEPRQVPDIGFKVFRTADTNIKWNLYDELGQLDTSEMTHTPDLADFTMGFSDIDVVYEVMLRQKDVPLSSTLETLTDISSRTYLYGSAYLVCLETEITEKLIDKLAALDPLPIKFVFRDSAFKDDINLKDETFRRLKNLIERNSGLAKKTYTVEFI